MVFIKVFIWLSIVGVVFFLMKKDYNSYKNSDKKLVTDLYWKAAYLKLLILGVSLSAFTWWLFVPSYAKAPTVKKEETPYEIIGAEAPKTKESLTISEKAKEKAKENELSRQNSLDSFRKTDKL